MNRATNNPVHTSRPGLSRIEVAVVIGMLAVVVALIGPAIWQARQSTHPVIGRDRLRFMGVAISQYEQIHKSLPQGGSPRVSPRAKASVPASQP